MIKITKNERNYLEENGCKFGDDLHRTYSKSKTYYATESNEVLALLKKYNDSIKVK